MMNNMVVKARFADEDVMFLDHVLALRPMRQNEAYIVIFLEKLRGFCRCIRGLGFIPEQASILDRQMYLAWRRHNAVRSCGKVSPPLKARCNCLSMIFKGRLPNSKRGSHETKPAMRNHRMNKAQ